MDWYGRKFRNAPNNQLSESGEEAGSLGTHLGEWVELGTEPHDEITLVTSLIDDEDIGGDTLHAPVLDIDIEHIYYHSTTPGHAALLLNVELHWDQYKRLLAVLLECGIIEQGFHDASIQRRYSACRTPWTKKPKRATFCESDDPEHTYEVCISGQVAAGALPPKKDTACCTFGTLENGKFVPRAAN